MLKRAFKIYQTKQFLSFTLVGVLCAVFHWASRIVLGFFISFKISLILSYVLAMTLAYTLNRIFVFPHTNRSLFETLRDFYVINLLMFPVVYFLSIFLSSLLLDVGFISYNEILAHGFSVLVPSVLTFLFYKFSVFGKAQ